MPDADFQTADAINGPLTGRTALIPSDRDERIRRERAVQDAVKKLLETERQNIMGPGPCVREFPFPGGVYEEWPMLPVDQEWIDKMLRECVDQLPPAPRGGSEIDLSDAGWIA